jgi:small-conductance mechanosensitive channel|tara:strand:+ start:1473 stop:2345 length:873 start_codon:yes stop_codon:yes gene_type:complete
MGCLTNLPTSLEPNLECVTEIANFGPVAALLTLIIGFPLVKLVLKYVKQFFEKYDYIDEGIENFLFKVVSVGLWLVIILTAANELGINVTGIVAALGIVGLAMAFAAQDTIENIIAGIFLMIDRPFREGDRILLPKRIGSLYSSWGDVSEIGLRTTKVRSTDGVLLTIPNKLLTKDTIANFNHKDDRRLRVRIRLGLVPNWKNVSKGEEIVESIAKSHEDICQTKPNPPQIVLRDFGDQEVIMEIRYYVPDAPQMRSTKSYFVKEILKQFEEQGVRLAYPTRLIMKEDIE